MRLWILLLIALLANFSSAKVAKRQADETEVVNEFEDSSSPTGQEGHEDTAVEAENGDIGESNDEALNNEENEEEPVGDEDHDTPVDNGEEQTEGSPQSDDEQETEPAVENSTNDTDEEADEDENASPAEENVEAEIAEATEEPITDDDETVQPASSQPTEENTETSDSTGQTDVLPSAIATDVPKEEKPIEAAAANPWVDSAGWTHYPWKKFPMSKIRYTKTRDCGCQIKWIKKVYKRWHPKPKVFLAENTYINLHRRKPCHRHHRPQFPVHHHHHHTHRPCRRHRHHHHAFHRKPHNSVQHVVYNHHSKPCFNKPIVKHITKVHQVRADRYSH